jgi:hypothetical protein
VVALRCDGYRQGSYRVAQWFLELACQFTFGCLIL